MHPVPDALTWLAGGWLVQREVRDLASGDEGAFTGRTEFTARPPDAGLLHHESGAFTWQDATRPAERTLLYVPGAVPGTIDVRFADGRPFHDLDLRTGRHRTHHPCAADRYDGEFTVTGPDAFRTVWRVGGPAKDLLLVTEYRRA
ncbi:DUF6314 family protein [Streptomyces sp. NPDC060194]|uniref:DUF6314 family protein n=1 Tax=Streptomyces sp. NPDC060194 TaxID=3347069 RepID=UPI0036555CAC